MESIEAVRILNLAKEIYISAIKNYEKVTETVLTDIYVLRKDYISKNDEYLIDSKVISLSETFKPEDQFYLEKIKEKKNQESG